MVGYAGPTEEAGPQPEGRAVTYFEVRQNGTARPADAMGLGRRLAEALLGQGAAEMVALAPRERAV